MAARTIYLITARVLAESDNPKETFKPLNIKGMFFPKKSRTQKVKIEEQCKQFVITHLLHEHPKLHLTIDRMKIESRRCDFTLNEDTQS